MLAKAKYTAPSYERETVPFLGLNRSDDTKEGEFSHQKNISDRRYPFLAPRLPRMQEIFKEDMQGLFHWDGHEIIVAGGTLYLDGEGVFNVISGAKQFAVVNTKLIVWPDGICVDLTNAKAKKLRAEMVNMGSAVFDAASLTLEPETIYSTTSRIYGWSNGGDGIYVWSYSGVSWNETSGWTLTGGAYTEINSTACVGRYYIPNVTYNSGTNSYAVDDPKASWGSASADKTVGNDIGFYCRFTKFAQEYASPNGGRGTLYWDVYWAQQANDALEQAFSVGDVVTVSGSRYGYYDVDGVKITDIDTESNTLYFADGTFRSGTAITKLDADVSESDKKYYVRYSAGDRYKYYAESDGNYICAKAGQYVLMDAAKLELYILDDAFDVINQHTMVQKTASDMSGEGAYRLELTPLSPTGEKIKVERKIPNLDLICERENRLWGVSNEDKTIYASALGDPTNFFDYSGDQGGFAVAVGSEGDFTGICDYGNAVLCWKERTLHKVLGDYPSNFQTATYRFAGVRNGAHKSLVNVNETLFFLGVDGVYAYTGNKPSLVSRALGADVLENGVGGTDGKAYYLSAKNGGAWELLSYDTHTGLWARSDETQVADFCRVGDDVKFLSGDTIYTIGGGDEGVEWEAVFVPMYETLEGGKQYNRLIFRVEVPKDGYMAADVRFDDGRWMQVGIVKGKSGPVSLPIPLRRCDKFEVRLRGKGDCAVLDMVREFRLRGEI